MSHSFVNCWIHALWSTKYRQQLIVERIEQMVYGEMRNLFEKAGCPVLDINGMPDHVHCLFRLGSEKSIADTIELVKGLSSHWINERSLLSDKFAWQTGYAAYSVSQSQVKKVSSYIKNQKIRHKRQTWEEEYNQLLRMHGLDPKTKKE